MDLPGDRNPLSTASRSNGVETTRIPESRRSLNLKTRHFPVTGSGAFPAVFQFHRSSGLQGSGSNLLPVQLAALKPVDTRQPVWHDAGALAAE